MQLEKRVLEGDKHGGEGMIDLEVEVFKLPGVETNLRFDHFNHTVSVANYEVALLWFVFDFGL